MRPTFYIVFETPLSGLRDIASRVCSEIQSLKEVKGCVAAWSVCETWVLRGRLFRGQAAVALF